MKVVESYEKTTLLLNRAWVPIGAITARAAFVHLFKGSIAALDKNSQAFHTLDTWESLAGFYNDQPVIRSAHDVWHIPTIVVVTSKFFRRPKKKDYVLRT
jgi:hypothetical protein|tara:strand:- start:1242 stop:1541 length:300 start_codon:yes stop_codon:yes gene_type:complete